MQTSEKIAELSKALAAAQAEVSTASKDKNNPFFKSKYADFKSVWDAVKGPLNKNGLSIIQPLDHDEGVTYVVTQLTHESGEFVKTRMPVVAKDQTNPQQVGSATTYMRRYSLASLLCVATDEDDDGNAAAGNKPKEQFKGDAKDYVIQCGKDIKGHKMGDIPTVQLQSMYDWAKKNPKFQTVNVQEFMQQFESYVKK